MSRATEEKTKKQHAHVAAWLDRLTGPQVRALACQHGSKTWESSDLTTLRTELLLTPSVQNIAGIPNGKEEAVQAG